MATIAQIVEQIRNAIYGKDVRENIAQGIEKCYEGALFVHAEKIPDTTEDYEAVLTQQATVEDDANA